MGREEEVGRLTEALSSQWEVLLERIRDKTQKLREANQQQQFNQVCACACVCLQSALAHTPTPLYTLLTAIPTGQAVSDLDFWFGEVEAQLSSGDVGRDLGGVQTLLKKHQLLEADIDAHQVIEFKLSTIIVILGIYRHYEWCLLHV